MRPLYSPALLIDLLWRFTDRLKRSRRNGTRVTLSLADMWRDSHEARLFASADNSELARLFFEHDGRIVDKWVHYLEVYERFLDRYRDTDFKMLEIGVFMGGSLEMWRRYFGPGATLFGVDIDPACAERVDAPNQVRIGSQDDAGFLHKVVKEMGGVDVVLDDGSHLGDHQRASFDILFPLLSDGGLYIIEDTHTSYWYEWSGGYRRPGSAVEFAKGLVDDMHHFYHGKQPAAGRKAIAGLHFFDSMIVIEKKVKQSLPIRTQVGAGTAPH